MKQFVVIGILTIFSIISGFSQSNSLDRLPEKERNDYLLTISKAVVMKHGPGYYRDALPPLIERHIVDEEERIAISGYEVRKYRDRVYYVVQYRYNEDEYEYEKDKKYYTARYFPAVICIWEDTGIAFRVMFGFTGFYGLDEREPGKEETRVVPYDNSIASGLKEQDKRSLEKMKRSREKWEKELQELEEARKREREKSEQIRSQNQNQNQEK